MSGHFGPKIRETHVKGAVVRTFREAGFKSHFRDQLWGRGALEHAGLSSESKKSYKLMQMLGALGVYGRGAMEWTYKAPGAGYTFNKLVNIAGVGNMHVTTLQPMPRQERVSYRTAGLRQWLLFMSGRHCHRMELCLQASNDLKNRIVPPRSPSSKAC